VRYYNEKGATLVETAVTLPVFILVLFGFIQLCLVAYTSLTLQYQVNNCLRWSSVYDEIVPGEDRFDSIKTQLTKNLNDFHVDTTQLEVNMCNGAVSNCTDTDAGNSGSFVTLQATVPAYNLFPLGQLVVTGRAVIKNEPF